MSEQWIRPYQGKFSGILLFGPPGSGKGTLGKFLASAGTQYHLSSGDIFRNLPLYSPAGRLYYSHASKGELLPDEATMEIWKYYVQGLVATNSFFPESQDLLLDGIPRTLRQAQMLSDYVDIRHIIVLEVSDRKELLQRMEKRALSEGRIEEISPVFLENRLQNYETKIHEILSYYPRHLISLVNAEQKPLEILRDVLVRLSHLLTKGGPQVF